MEQNKRILSLQIENKNIKYQLRTIQSRDLWKAIVNHNCIYLNIEPKGYYDERIDKIIMELKKYKKSEGQEIYIHFFENVKGFIEFGNKKAHQFYIKYPLGMKSNYVNALFKSHDFKNIKSNQLKSLKDILNALKTEEMLEKFMEGENFTENKDSKLDIKTILMNIK